VQILLNLLRNAGDAVIGAGPKRDGSSCRLAATGDARFSIELADNGVGIAREHLELVFAPGFTTCKSRRGFGLHDSILSARSMDGQLRCASQGPGQGAVFTLELPPVAARPGTGSARERDSSRRRGQATRPHVVGCYDSRNRERGRSS